jgi:hypothetical protein
MSVAVDTQLALARSRIIFNMVHSYNQRIISVPRVLLERVWWTFHKSWQLFLLLAKNVAMQEMEYMCLKALGMYL